MIHRVGRCCERVLLCFGNVSADALLSRDGRFWMNPAAASTRCRMRRDHLLPNGIISGRHCLTFLFHLELGRAIRRRGDSHCSGRGQSSRRDFAELEPSGKLQSAIDGIAQSCGDIDRLGVLRACNGKICGRWETTVPGRGLAQIRGQRQRYATGSAEHRARAGAAVHLALAIARAAERTVPDVASGVG